MRRSGSDPFPNVFHSMPRQPTNATKSPAIINHAPTTTTISRRLPGLPYGGKDRQQLMRFTIIIVMHGCTAHDLLVCESRLSLSFQLG